MPDVQGSDTQLETVIGRIMHRSRGGTTDILARAGSTIDPATSWGLFGVYLRRQLLDWSTSQSDIEDQIDIPHGVLTSFFDELAAAGYLLRDGDVLALTSQGEQEVARIVDAWRDWLMEQLHDWLPDEDKAELRARAKTVVERITRRVILEQQRESVPA
jgi:hypothetical protein